MKLINNYKFTDLMMLQMIIVMLAFKDFSVISLISQILCFIVIFLNSLKKNGLKVKVDLYLTSKIIFLIWCILSSIWALESSSAVFACKQIIFRLMTGITIILYVDEEEKVNTLLKFIIFASIVLCARIVLEVPISAWGNERVGNYLAHDINNSYSNTGITYVLGFAIAFLTLNENVIKKNRTRFFLVTIFTFFSFLSGSKKQILLLVITIGAYTIYKSKNTKKLIKNLLIATILIVSILFLILNNEMLYNMIGHRVIAFLSFFSDNQSISSQADLSTIGRNQLLLEAIETFKEKPLLGVGIGNFINVSSFKVWAENNYLELLADVGVIGCILYYYGTIKVFKYSLKNIKKRKTIDIQILVGLLCFVIIDFTMVSYFNSTLQLYLAYIFAMYNVQRAGNKLKIKKE